ncbi:unnamed protein product, partial [marine sediment metagenome]
TAGSAVGIAIIIVKSLLTAQFMKAALMRVAENFPGNPNK